MASRARRLSSTKRRRQSAPQPLGREPNAPTAAEWKTLGAYQIFQLSDDANKEYDFEVGKCARIIPNGRKPDEDIEETEFWFVRIEEIRARSVEDVWARVRYFYSPPDPDVGIHPGFDSKDCGQYELIWSDHADCLPSSVFDGTVEIVQLDEDNLEQERIPPETFFYRYALETSKKKTLSPAPGSTCTCGEPYSPDADTVMHLCPAPTCRRWYHKDCVAHTATAGASRPRAVYVLTNPDTGTPISSAVALLDEPPAKRRHLSNGKGKAPAPTTMELASALASALAGLPTRLVRAATQPIVRGAGAGASIGVAGNVRAVMAARRIVCDALAVDGEGMSKEVRERVEGWETLMPEGWEEGMVQGWERDEDGDVEMNGEGVPPATAPPRITVKTNATPVKRGRGRPRKTDPLPTPTSPSPPASVSAKEDQEEEEKPVKRGRGRPRKSESASTSVSAPTEVLKRKRGRPSKNQTASASASTPATPMATTNKIRVARADAEADATTSAGAGVLFTLSCPSCGGPI